MKGLAMPRDVATAVKYYKKAADGGFLIGAYNYGRCLERGNGVDQNLTEAIRYYEIAANEGGRADEGYPRASFALARCLEEGMNGTLDLKAAAKYYKATARAGMKEAQLRYGSILEKGLGVKVNVTKAVQDYAMAAANGYERAEARLNEMVTTDL
jgi:TPR repeat protein